MALGNWLSLSDDPWLLSPGSSSILDTRRKTLREGGQHVPINWRRATDSRGTNIRMHENCLLLVTKLYSLQFSLLTVLVASYRNLSDWKVYAGRWSELLPVTIPDIFSRQWRVRLFEVGWLSLERRWKMQPANYGTWVLSRMWWTSFWNLRLLMYCSWLMISSLFQGLQGWR